MIMREQQFYFFGRIIACYKNTHTTWYISLQLVVAQALLNMTPEVKRNALKEKLTRH
jgi:hypothetical protein